MTSYRIARGSSSSDGLWHVAHFQRDLLPESFARDTRQRPHCLNRPALAADQLAHVGRRRGHLDQRRIAVLRFCHGDSLRRVGESLRDGFDDIPHAAHAVAPAFSALPAALSAEGLRCLLSNVRTVSESCAPFPTQCSIRARSISTLAGFVRGL